MLTKAVIISTLIIGSLAQAYEDKRCRCMCPSPAEVFNGSMSVDRKLFNTDVPPSKCNCVGVILPRMGDEIKGRETEYCPRCECKYETRNTAVIKVVVITVIWLLTLLLVYAAFLACLDPLTRNRRLRHLKDHASEEFRSQESLMRRQRSQRSKGQSSEEAQLLIHEYVDED